MKKFETDTILNLNTMPAFERELLYCGLDTMVTHDCFGQLLGQLTPESRGTYETSKAFMGPAMYMMRRGFKVDLNLRDQVVAEQRAHHAKLDGFLQELAEIVWGRPLNYNSPKQMLEFFFGDWLFIPTMYENKKGEMKPSTGRPVLERMLAEYPRAEPFCNLILGLRDADKIISTLNQDLLEGRWHASFNPVGTDTWRWSSSNHPLGVGANLQNIDDEVRRAFVPDDEFVLFSFDQQGAEAKGVAYITGDESYIKAVESNDVHTMVASMVFGIPNDPAESKKLFYRGDSYRQIAKKFSHGSNYNGTPHTLARQARTPRKLVEEFQIKYFKAFKGIQEWHRWTARQLETKGYLISAYGDKRQFWNRLWDASTIRSAIAFQPQHIVGKLTAVACYRIWSELPHKEVQLLANGHDAVILQIRKNSIATYYDKVLECLDNPLVVTDIKGKSRTLRIPWDAEVGYNWGKRKEDDAGRVINPLGMRRYRGPITLLELDEQAKKVEALPIHGT